MIEGDQKEYMDDLIWSINSDAKGVKKLLEKKAGYDIIRWDELISNLALLDRAERMLYTYCQEHNPPKDYKCSKNEKGNVQCFGGHRKNLPEHLKEYDFSNVDPEGYKECQEYWKFPVAKAKIEMIEAFQHICEGKKPPVKKYYLG